MTDWGTAAISTELGSVTAGMDTIADRLADAYDLAARAKVRMASGQLLGVAAGIGQIQTEIEKTHAQAKSAGGRVHPILSTVGRISNETTPDDVVAILNPVLGGLDAAKAATLQIRQGITSATVATRRNLKGGRPEQILARLGAAKSAIDPVAQRFDRAKTATLESIRRAREAGAGAGK